VYDQNFHLLQTFASNNRTQGQIEKSQQELKSLENRKYKNFCFCYMFKTIFLGTTKFGKHEKSCFRKRLVVTGQHKPHQYIL